jgi:spoIIIJ-associated protein
MPRRDELAEPARRNVTPDRPARRADRPESIPAQVGPPPDLEGGRRRRRRRRGGRGRGAGDEAASPAQPDHAILDHEQPYREPESVAAAEIESPAEPPAMMHEPRGDEMPAPELEREATGFTSELLTKMGYEAQVSARADGTRVDVHAVVPDGGDELTGPRGEVRQALQHILNRMINRGGRSTYHLQLEINDFWERREAELQGLARRLAEEALQANGEIVTEYLNSQERRIVHVTLKPDTRVKTYALGTGLIKRVAIAPADYPEPEAGEE